MVRFQGIRPEGTLRVHSNLQPSEYVYNVIRTLRTSSIAAIVERLRPFLHIDPVAVLPAEITAEIFSYLPPPMLLEASKASRAWRERIMDSRLWKQKFTAEGWSLDMGEVSRWEQECQNKSRGIARKARSRKAEAHSQQRKQKRRAPNHDNLDGDVTTSPHDSHARDQQQSDTQSWNDQGGLVEADTEEDTLMEDSMYDHDMHDAPTLSRMDTRSSLSSNIAHAPSAASMPSPGNAVSGGPSVGTDSSIQEPSLVLAGMYGAPRLNFHQVYKQKRKLEENWNLGKFKPFQLPHQDHPEEAHKECVYTIQYSGKYLVSGSRDRTLRIWDLETQRLIGEPLTGHTGSVLCLQFDESEKEDIIVSGSSDTDVILWKFSTGEMIKKLPRAHKESVLNLKFDERFLVTCSKDKTIKIWNRHELRPGDKDYPIRNIRGGGKCPSYIVDLASCATPLKRGHNLSTNPNEPLEKYTLIMTIDTHGAAVNAIHIYKDQLVSASGDRSLKVFNIHSGVCTANCQGHTKGIACVQYDGKRIVSGSSDNTIRIYDPITQVEVACLQGHAHLVRTIQAAFGDAPGSRDELEEEARTVDRQYFEARSSGTVPSSSMGARRTRERNAGSRDPKSIMAYGAKLPPGGGGSRWGRIVSGSYDETVIIWKKAPDGSWVISHRLRQGKALRAAGGPLMAHSELQRQAQLQAISQQQNTNGHGPSNNPPHGQTPQAGGPANNQQGQAAVSAQQIIHQALQTGAAALQTGMDNIAANHLHFPVPPIHPLPPHLAQQRMQMQQRQLMIHQHQLQRQQSQQAQQQVAQQVAQQMAQQAAQQSPQQPPQQQAAGPSTAPLLPYPANWGRSQNDVLPAATPVTQPNARVFKLQFDARRIICCSQDPKIVGWDFANGDEDIVECSRFFGVPT